MLLLDYLVQKYPQARKTTLRRMVQEGRVRINGRPAGSAKQEVGEKDQVKVLARPERAKASIEPLRVIHEDADILVVDKPAGLLTSTTPREPRRTAIALIRAYLADREPRARAGVIHRLDRDASGLLVFSRNNDAFEHLKGQFFRHTVTRLYSAVVHGHLKEKAGRIESLLVEYADGTVHTTTHKVKGQPAVTQYEVIAEHPNPPLSLLHVKLETGRKHQIRVHLAEMGHPIVGDEVYGGGGVGNAEGDVGAALAAGSATPTQDSGLKTQDFSKTVPAAEAAPTRPQPPSPRRLLLCATLLELDHPRTGERMRFEIPLPKELRVTTPM